MLSHAKTRSIYTRTEALSYIGSLLRVELNINNHNTTDVEVGEIFLEEHICVHVKENQDKVNILCLMI
jgi:DNA-directed RNA polymerase I subunit RPA2